MSALAAPRYNNFLYGVAYYPEHWPENTWERDARLMQEAGVNTVRIGEFAWYLMEPKEGVFDFSLFDRAIAVLAKHGIKTHPRHPHCRASQMADGEVSRNSRRLP